jgi:hypothetical protein
MITTFKIANIITHVALIAVLIIVIFFTYGLKVEHQVVEREIKYLIKKVLDPVSQVYPDIVKHKDEYASQIVITPDSPEVIKEIDDHNKELKLQTLKYLVGLILVTLIAVLIIAWKFTRVSDGKVLTYKQFLVKLVKYNIVTLIFVAAVYIGFTYFIGHNFIYIDYHRINSTVIQKLIEIRGPATTDKLNNLFELQQIFTNKAQRPEVQQAIIDKLN